jgi:hypothetical protein
MTITLAALFMVLLTVALLWEQRCWDRRHPSPPARSNAALPHGGVVERAGATTLRCLCCDGAPLVDDIATHSRLAHGQRVPAPEDSREWAP